MEFFGKFFATCQASTFSIVFFQETEMRLPARGKYDFAAQTAKEYPVKKGQSVVITKQVDSNWYMVQSVDGKKSGIVPVSYLEVSSE